MRDVEQAVTNVVQLLGLEQVGVAAGDDNVPERGRFLDIIEPGGPFFGVREKFLLLDRLGFRADGVGPEAEAAVYRADGCCWWNCY